MLPRLLAITKEVIGIAALFAAVQESEKWPWGIQFPARPGWISAAAALPYQFRHTN